MTQCLTKTQCLKITEKVSFNIASEASYVYILNGQKFFKNAKNGEKLKNAKIEKFKCDILSNFQTNVPKVFFTANLSHICFFQMQQSLEENHFWTPQNCLDYLGSSFQNSWIHSLVFYRQGTNLEERTELKNGTTEGKISSLSCVTTIKFDQTVVCFRNPVFIPSICAADITSIERIFS